MADLASLFIKVDSKGVVTASKDLDKLTDVSKKTEKATDSVTAGFGRQLSIVKQLAVAYGAYKMAQYIKDATMLAARYETLGVVMRVVGNNAGFSGAQMEIFAKGLEKTGISMISSRQALIRMTQAQLDLTKSSQLARIAQDAAVIGNINSSEAFTRLVQGIQTAQVEILRNIGINVNFQKSYQAVADATGKTANSFTEAEKAQIRLNAVMKAGEGIAGSYEASMETAGKQVLSLERHIENLKAMFGEAFTPALAEIIATITGDIKALNGELSGAGAEAIRDWGNNFRLIIIETEANLMRVAMLIDKIGGNMTQMVALLGTVARWSPAGLAGRAFDIDPGGDVADWAIEQNQKLEKRYNATSEAIGKLAARYEDLLHAMTPAGKQAAKQAADALEAARLEATQLKNREKEIKSATKEEIKIQDDFAKAYKKSILTTHEFETDSLKIQVAAFKKAKVDEVQLEQWMQNELKNIKLRAQNEALALFEELAQNDDFYAQKAIDTMSDILDAEEKKWAKILDSDNDAHRLRIQKEEEYKNKVLGNIDDIVNAQVSASRKAATVTSSGSSVLSRSSSGYASGPVLGGTRDVIAGKVFINDRSGARAYAQQLKDIKAMTIQSAQDTAEETARISQQAAEDAAQKAIDIRKKTMDLGIRILELTGDKEGALAATRARELLATDELLRPLQMYIFALEDAASAVEEANNKVADAQNAATDAANDLANAERDVERATNELITAQQKQARELKDSLSSLVNQGRSIQDFINSLGATGVSMTFAAAKASYAADLAGARAGDATSFNRITQSAGAFISSATQTAGSSVELERIVSGIKGELAGLSPVEQLEENSKALEMAIASHELLELIESSTKDTSILTAEMKLSVANTALNTAQTELNTAYTALESANTALNTALTAQATISLDINGISLEETSVTWDPSNPMKSVFDAIMNSTETTATNTGKTLAFQVETSPSRWIEPVYKPYPNNDTLQKAGYWESAHGFAEYTDGSRTTYAKGGVFNSGIVSQPTEFNNSIMGEAGPEAIMPLVRGPQGLGVRSAGGDSSAEQMAELKRIRQSIEAGSIANVRNSTKIAKILTRFDDDGMPAERIT